MSAHFKSYLFQMGSIPVFRIALRSTGWHIREGVSSLNSILIEGLLVGWWCVQLAISSESGTSYALIKRGIVIS